MSLVIEDRRLKVGGLLLAALGGAAVGWVMTQLDLQWPPPVDHRWSWLIVALAGLNGLAAGLLVMAAGFGVARPWVDQRRRRALGLQLLLANLLAPLLFLGFYFDDPRAGGRDDLDAWQIALAAGGYLLGFAAWRLWRRSQRHAAPSAEEALAVDPRAPVVYLRSFRDDGASLVDAEHGRIAHWWMDLLALPTPEQDCAAELDGVGPVVAIGKPGEPLPELGAARLYVGHDVWQAEVRALMDRAALVVLRIGGSPGVLWELEQALSHVRRERLILAMIGDVPVATEVAARLAPELGAAWDAALPEAPVRASVLRRWLRWHPSERRVGALVCFPAGAPRVVEVRRMRRGADHALWREPVKWMYRASFPLRSAWQEVFVALGLQRPAALGKSRAVAVGLALLLGGFGAHWLYLGQRRRAFVYVLAFPVLALSLFLAWFDALRFVWIERAEFDRRYHAGD